jgi:hypothetical protein
MTTSLVQKLDPEFAQPGLPGIELSRREPTAGQLLQIALEKDSGIEIIERITALMERERDYQARVTFDDQLNRCQAQIGRIAPNQRREHGIMWADYAQLDRVLRPIYIQAGFSIGFSEVESSDKTRLRMRATLSAKGISREYFAEISKTPASPAMSQADADASAASRVKRYLLLDIFNIAIGIDKDEKAPYQAKPEDLLDESVVLEFIDSIKAASNPDELKRNYLAATKAGAGDPSALRAFDQAKKDTWKMRGFKA